MKVFVYIFLFGVYLPGGINSFIQPHVGAIVTALNGLFGGIIGYTNALIEFFKPVCKLYTT